MGGLSKEDYIAAAPPNSFIHIDDFESPKSVISSSVVCSSTSFKTINL